MKVQITQALRFKKQDTAIELKVGDIVTLPDNRALQLIKCSKAKALLPIPEPCQDCWACVGDTCIARVHSVPCADAVTSCEYQQDLYKEGRSMTDDEQLRTYSAAYAEAAERLNDRFYPAAYGCLDWIKQRLPQTYSAIRSIERQLQQPLKNGLKLSEFTDLVKRWEQLHINAIQKYLKTTTRQN